MATRPKGYGMSAELAAKRDARYDPAMETKVRNWISAVTGVPASSIGTGQDAFQESLKSGAILCQLINKLSPGSVKKVNESKMAFKQMENIGNYLAACDKYGLAKHDQFQTVDLYEAQNVPQVIDSLLALGRTAKAKGFAPVP